MKYISFFILFSIAFALAPFGPAGDWIEAKWSADGGIYITPVKYQGIYIWREGYETIKISDKCRAGYKFSIDNEGNNLAFLSCDEPCEKRDIEVFDLSSMKSQIVASGKGLGIPMWTSDGDIQFFNGEKTITADIHGKIIETFSCGSHITIPTTRGPFWCDNNGIPRFFDKNKNAEIEIPYGLDKGSFAFEPIISKDYKWVAFQETRGHIFIINMDNFKAIDIGAGDKPIFVDYPFGILFFEMSDDGEIITDSKLYFTPIIDGVPREKNLIISSKPKEYIFICADYSQEFGLLLVADDGRIFVDNIDLTRFTK